MTISDRNLGPGREPGRAGTERRREGRESSPGMTVGGLPGDPGLHPFLAPARGPDELGWLGHYRVKRLIGQGAIGLVFLGEDSRLCRSVALKVIKPELAGDEQVMSRFVREARATAAIKHDHIFTIYQVDREGGTLFLAMEYLEGLTLQEWLDRGRKASLPVVLKFGREIASGLAAAHRNGLIHRDIKPANLWVEAPGGRIKILDFGMARSERERVQLTHVGTIMGTPAYMSPEQADGELATFRSDLFSLGCVLYRLCAGRSPFDGASVMAVLSALAKTTPEPLPEIDPEIDRDFEALVSRLLAKDPADRPASAQEVVDSIKVIERKLLA